MVYNINYKKIYFTSSIPNLYQLPTDNTTEIAFIGKSNSGKSSTINILTTINKLAKISKKPGSTKLINLFEIPFKIRLIDFPGYGYSPISKKIKKPWEIILYQYFKTRKNLKGIVLITDIRHLINQTDKNIIEKIKKNNIHLLILLNKSDKLSQHISHLQLNKIKKIFTSHKIHFLISSTKTSEGIHNLRKTINYWYNNIQEKLID